jgi:hypothetical protein
VQTDFPLTDGVLIVPQYPGGHKMATAGICEKMIDPRWPAMVY